MQTNFRNLLELVAIGGAVVLGVPACSGDDEDKADTGAEAGCPTAACPTAACPTTPDPRTRSPEPSTAGA